VEVQLHEFFTAALDASEWPASRPGRFTAWERAPGTHWTGGWMGPESVWTWWMREKFLAPSGNRNPVVHSVALYKFGIPQGYV